MDPTARAACVVGGPVDVRQEEPWACPEHALHRVDRVGQRLAEGIPVLFDMSV